MPPGAQTQSFLTFPWLLPVVGWIVVLTFPLLLRGAARRMTFAIGPFLLGWAMWWTGLPVPAHSGDWLVGIAALLLYGCACLAIVVYYALLLPVAIGGWLRHNAELRKAAAEAHAD